MQAGGDRAAFARALYTDLMVALAGVAAQKLADFPTDENDFSGDGDDLNNAMIFAVQLARIEAGLSPRPGADGPLADPLHAAARAIYKRAGTETVALLKNNWQAVERVADVPR